MPLKTIHVSPVPDDRFRAARDIGLMLPQFAAHFMEKHFPTFNKVSAAASVGGLQRVMGCAECFGGVRGPYDPGYAGEDRLGALFGKGRGIAQGLVNAVL